VKPATTWRTSHGSASTRRDIGTKVPNLLRNGVLRRLLEMRPELKYLVVHNIDTLGADLDPGVLGEHIRSGKI